MFDHLLSWMYLIVHDTRIIHGVLLVPSNGSQVVKVVWMTFK